MQDFNHLIIDQSIIHFRASHHHLRKIFTYEPLPRTYEKKSIYHNLDACIIMKNEKELTLQMYAKRILSQFLTNKPCNLLNDVTQLQQYIENTYQFSKFEYITKMLLVLLNEIEIKVILT